jgi:hypothetical protein
MKKGVDSALAASKPDLSLVDSKVAAEIAKIKKIGTHYVDPEGAYDNRDRLIAVDEYEYTWPSRSNLRVVSYNTYEGLVDQITKHVTDPPKPREATVFAPDDYIAPEVTHGYVTEDGRAVAYVTTGGSLIRHDDATVEDWAAAVHLHGTGRQDCGDPTCWMGLDGGRCVAQFDQPAKQPRKDPRLRLTPVADIPKRATAWLWQDRMPAGEISVLTGRGDVGKSTVALDWAADISRGRLTGIHYGRPKSVIIAATEDDFGRTIRPRLEAADADLMRVFRVDTTKEFGKPLDLPVDIEELSDLIQDNDVALVIMDPLLSRLNSGLDTHKDSDVRRALEPLAKMAQRTKCAVLGFVHFNKGSSKDVIERVSASGAITNVARSVFVVVKDEDNEVRVLGQVKNNLGHLDHPAKAFTIEDTYLGDDDGGEPIHAGHVVWHGEAERSVQDIMDDAGSSRGRHTKEEVAEWLGVYLTRHGKTLSNAVKEAAREEGFSVATLDRARRELLDVEVTGQGRKTTWTLRGAASGPEPGLLDGLQD